MQGIQRNSTPEQSLNQRPEMLGPLEAAQRYLERQKENESVLAVMDEDEGSCRPAWLRLWPSEVRVENEVRRSPGSVMDPHAPRSSNDPQFEDETGAELANGLSAGHANGYSGQSIEAAFAFETVFHFETELEAEATEDWLDLSGDEGGYEEIAERSSNAIVQANEEHAAQSRTAPTAPEIPPAPGAQEAAEGKLKPEIELRNELRAELGEKGRPSTTNGPGEELPQNKQQKLAAFSREYVTAPETSGKGPAPDPQAVRAAIFRLAQESPIGRTAAVWPSALDEDENFSDVARRVWGEPAGTHDAIAETDTFEVSGSGSHLVTSSDRERRQGAEEGGRLGAARSLSGEPDVEVQSDPDLTASQLETNSHLSPAGQLQDDPMRHGSRPGSHASADAASPVTVWDAWCPPDEEVSEILFKSELNLTAAGQRAEAPVKSAIAAEDLNPSAVMAVEGGNHIPADRQPALVETRLLEGSDGSKAPVQTLHPQEQADSQPLGGVGEAQASHPLRQEGEQLRGVRGNAGEAPALAHDAGNLLSALKLYSELLALSGVLHARHKHYAQDLKLLAARSEVLIDRLLSSCSVAEDQVRSLIRENAGRHSRAADKGATVETVNSGHVRLGGAGEGGIAAEETRGVPAGVAPEPPGIEANVPTVPGTQDPGPLSADEPGKEELKRSGPVQSGGSTVAPINMVHLLTKWGSLLSMIAHGSLEVKFGPQAGLPIGVAEEAMERILVNLVHNAMTATQSGGAIRIGVGRAEKRRSAPSLSSSDGRTRPGNRMVLTVDDSGCGMNEEQLAKVLGKAQRADLSAVYAGDSNPAGGRRHGMGLQIVRELVLASGGQFAVYSRCGVGTRIEMEWPTVGEVSGLGRFPPASVAVNGESTLQGRPGVAYAVTGSTTRCGEGAVAC